MKGRNIPRDSFSRLNKNSEGGEGVRERKRCGGCGEKWKEREKKKKREWEKEKKPGSDFI